MKRFLNMQGLVSKSTKVAMHTEWKTPSHKQNVKHNVCSCNHNIHCEQTTYHLNCKDNTHAYSWWHFHNRLPLSNIKMSGTLHSKWMELMTCSSSKTYNKNPSTSRFWKHILRKQEITHGTGRLVHIWEKATI